MTPPSLLTSCCCALLFLASLATGFPYDDATLAGGPMASVRSRLGLASQGNGLMSHAALRKRSKVAKRLSVGAGFLKIDVAPPKSLEARQHGRVVLECSASGNPTAQIAWYKDGKPFFQQFGTNVEPRLLDNFQSGSMSETRSRLALECVSEADAGIYECVAQNMVGKKSVETEVTVVSYDSQSCSNSQVPAEYAKPVITEWMTTLLQALGTEARLICRSPNMHETSWIAPSGEEIVSDGKKYRILSDGDLVIHNLSFKEMGLFRCIASNENGEDYSETFVYPHAG